LAHLEYLERREVLRADRAGSVYHWTVGDRRANATNALMH
jgi:hypothetical protein